MSDRHADQRRFAELLPFYVNETLSADERHWMDEFLASHPEVRGEARFVELMRDAALKLAEERPADHGLDRLLARIRAEREPLSWLERLSEWMNMPRLVPSPVLALFAAVVVVQAVLIGTLLREPGEGAAYDLQRGVGAQPKAVKASLRVVFSPSASVESISRLLRSVNASVVAGPTETGEYWLALPPTRQADEVAAILRTSAAVDDVMIVEDAGK